MKKKELNAIAKEYARAVYRAWETEKVNRERIDKRIVRLEQVLDEAKRRARAVAEEQLLNERNEIDELEKLVNGLMKGE